MNETESARISDNYSGFTIIEFVVAIVIIGIISVTVMSRFIDSNAMNGIVVRDQTISLVRKAQQYGIGRDTVKLEIQPNAQASNVNIKISDLSGEIESAILGMEGLSLTGDLNISQSCATTGGTTAITNTNKMELSFTILGDLGISFIGPTLVGAVVSGPISSAVRLCVNNDPAMSICISPSGFAYKGNCDA